MTQLATTPAPAAPLDKTLRTVIVLVVLGGITTVLDVTIVSVALDRLATDFHTPLSTLQWVMSGYLLAFTAVIPLTGWASDRFGSRSVWLTAVGLFTGGSLLCGLAWSAESLIAFRMLQGVGGGMVMPVGMTMVARAAGPERMGRAMAVVGIPMMLGPILGPVVGGVLVDTVDWRWIFFINLPLGALCLALSSRHLEHEPGSHRQRLDVPGVLLLSPGLAALVYGVSLVARDGEVTGPVLAWCICGAILLVGFVARALTAEHPLLDLHPFRDRGFTTAALVQFLTVGCLTGAMFLLPLYYLTVRGETELATGLLLAPQGVGAAVSMATTGRLVDAGRGTVVVAAGTLLLAAGFAGFLLAGATTSYVALVPAQVLLGLGAGCLFAPTSAAAYARLDRQAIANATTTLSILQRGGGVLATAAFAVVLQQRLAEGQSFNGAFSWPLAIALLALLPALALPALKPTLKPTLENGEPR